jgi:hypothetical protein
LVRHEFGFGTAIKARAFVGTDELSTKYREFIIDHFNWVVFENAMKWRPMEKYKVILMFYVQISYTTSLIVLCTVTNKC